MLGRRIPFTSVSLLSISISRLRRFSMNLRTHDIMASEAVVIVRIENISGTRFFAL